MVHANFNQTTGFDISFQVSEGLNIKYIPELLYTGQDGIYSLYLTGEFPTAGYSFIHTDVWFIEKYLIEIRTAVSIPTGPVDLVITPFREYLGDYHLANGMYQIVYSINQISPQTIHAAVEEGTIKPVVDPGPINVQSPLLEPYIDIQPFEIDQGEPVAIHVGGKLPSTAFEVVDERISFEHDLLIIRVKVIEQETGDDVIVPYQREFVLNNLEAGNYHVLLNLNEIVVTESKFHVRGEIIEPRPEMPFGAELRFEIPHSGSTETVFYLTGMFPTPGFTFTEKTIELEGEQVVIHVTIEPPSGPVAQVITPFHERLGSIDLPYIWSKMYMVFATVNGFNLEMIPLGGGLIDSRDRNWAWMDVEIEPDHEEKSNLIINLIGESYQSALTVYDTQVEITGHRIKITAIVPNNIAPDDQSLKPFNNQLGAIEIDPNQDYVVDVFINQMLIKSVQIRQGAVSSTQNWEHYSH